MKLINNCTAEDILSLKENGVPESKYLEYKRDLPGNSDSEKSEFLADVSAFANTQGGVIIYGVEETKDENGKNTGTIGEIVGINKDNIDPEIQRLENILRDSLQPKLYSPIFKKIEVNGKIILIIRIYRSLFAPHMVSFKGASKFYIRGNSRKDQMDINELRQAFLQTEEWEKAADNFRRERIMKARSGEIIPNLDISKPSYFLHILPLGTRDTMIDIKELKNYLCKILDSKILDYSSNFDFRFNLEGYYIQSKGSNNYYKQYFRNGGIEIYNPIPTPCKNVLEGSRFENNVIEEIKEYFSLVRKLEVEPPFAIFLTCLGIKEFSISSDQFPTKVICRYDFDKKIQQKFDRDDILFRNIIFKSFDKDIDKEIDKLIQPIFDIFWQSAGWDGNPFYNEDGSRK